MTTAVAESPVIRILGERKETTPRPVAVGVSGQPIGPASTLGWDTAFAIKIRDVNAEMTKPGICPAGFDEDVTGLCSAKGSFGHWKITVGEDGGDQGILRMTLPVTSGSLQFGGITYAISNASALLDVELQYLPDTGAQIKTGQRFQLILKKTSSDLQRKAVHVTDFSVQPGPDHDLIRALMIATLDTWCNEHLDEFVYVFASVDLNVVLQQEHLQWLAPTATGYAYHNGTTEDDSLLGVLCMTSGKKPTGLASQLSPWAVPAGQRAGFLISTELFLENIVLPSLPKSFANTTVADFRLDPNGPSIVNQRELDLPSVQYNGTTYYPKLQTMRLQIDGNEMRLESQTRVDISPGITTYIKETSYQQVAVTADGKSLTMTQSRPRESDHWTDIATWVKVVEDILIVIAIIVDLILAALTGGAALVLGAILATLIFGLAAATPELIAAIAGEGVAGDAPSIQQLVLAAIGTLNWQGAKEFKLTSAAFSECFQVGGDPCFVHS